MLNLKRIWYHLGQIRRTPIRADVCVAGGSASTVAAAASFSSTRDKKKEQEEEEEKIWKEYFAWRGPWVTDGGEDGQKAQDRLNELNADPKGKVLSKLEIHRAKLALRCSKAKDASDHQRSRYQKFWDQALTTNEDHALEQAVEAEILCRKYFYEWQRSIKDLANFEKKHEMEK